MRLIDADALKEVFKEKGSEAVCGVELCKAIISQIDNQPTVEAFPLEWLINKYAYATEDILKDWESYLKEQAERKEE